MRIRTTIALAVLVPALALALVRSPAATAASTSRAHPPEDGYRLWLRYQPVADRARLDEYRKAVREVAIDAGGSPALRAVEEELRRGLTGLLGKAVPFVPSPGRRPGLLVGTPRGSDAVAALGLDAALGAAGDEGYLLARRGDRLVVAANSDRGVLYGVFAFLRHLQTEGSLRGLDVASAPRKRLRLLNHWDNLDGTVERGYAGPSLWDWAALPDRIDPRYRDYARAMGSVGLNGTVLTNVNADARVLTAEYLGKVGALAGALRPYGVRVYLTARFSAPREIGGLPTADPLDPRVAAWWRAKADEIYRHVPDFGGFLVKANSEGQPGPQDYKRTHADGANVLADALSPHGGVVIWRAFVYDRRVPDDRAKQAFTEFRPLDGAFRGNVFVQVKNGPIDFQPREPFHPLLGAMPRTPLLVELQITQEYLGFATHLVYLAPLFEETLDSDTFAQGPGSTVAGSVAGMAGVANVGGDRNWCGHPFGQANWYAFGRLAWDPGLGAAEIADEWLRMTFTNDRRFVEPVKAMMLGSRQAAVDYMTPLGLHHLMAKDHHYGPGPWVSEGRADWTSVYYHRADAHGIGFDRTPSGSNAVAQYHPPWQQRFADPATCPEPLLLWFHHLPWDHVMASGRPLWDELGLRYDRGVEAVRGMRRTWDGMGRYVDRARFERVRDLLAIQEDEARWWRDASILYFQQFARRPLPAGVTPPEHPLEHYKQRTPARAPGHHPHPGPRAPAQAR